MGNRCGRVTGFVVAVAALLAPVLPGAQADDFNNIESAFDQAFKPGHTARADQSGFAARVAALASATQGRIGLAAVDLDSGERIEVLGDQPFPLASTSKIAIVATYLDGVDRGRLSLDAAYPLMMPVPSKKFDGPVAPVRPGASLSALSLIELALTRSDNHATDALLAAIGGPRAVNAWIKRAGITGFHLDRDIATLVRDDGAVDPAVSIDRRDSTTPLAMVQLLTGLYRGQWLSARSQQVLLQTMSRCLTGKRRIVANLPEGAMVAHKTGSLSNTSSDVGIITTPDGRAMAVAIYVTGQGNRLNREARIATLARAIYDGYQSEPSIVGHSAAR